MTDKGQFAKLFEPISIGEMQVKNRIVMPAMGTNYASEFGYVTEKTKNYYEARAKGGAGLVIIEVTCIDAPVGKTIIRQLAIDDDSFLPGLSELAQAIQQHGARAAVQLGHAGRSAKPIFTRMQPVAPSAIPDTGGFMPRALTPAEIRRLVTKFAEGAERAKKTGFDAVEIHSTHGYLLAQFLSPASNKRHDAYGGELKNRARFLLEVIHAIRETVGKSYPVWCRLNGAEFMPDGLTLDDAKQVAIMAQDAGVDAINVSSFPQTRYRFPSMGEPPGNIVQLAEGIKKVVNVPIITVGKITPELALEVLERGKADLVAMGRALIADPDLPNKLASGRKEDIIPCIGCDCCHQTLRNFGTEDGFVRCAVNTMTGREREYALKPAKKAKKVLIVGGGPSGMEAARVAKLRGHDVTLYEKNSKLGGQLLLARMPPHKDGIDLLIDYLGRAMTRLSIQLELGKEVTPELIKKIKPDVVIVATGATAFVPEIPGIHRENVVTAEDVLTGKANLGDTVVVVGAGLIGCETAEFLVENGKKVTIAEMLPEINVGVVWSQAPRRLAAQGVKIYTGVTCECIIDNGLKARTAQGKELMLQADTVVIAAGAKPNSDLLRKVREVVYEVYFIGDCMKPRRIIDAINDASYVSRKV